MLGGVAKPDVRRDTVLPIEVRALGVALVTAQAKQAPPLFKRVGIDGDGRNGLDQPIRDIWGQEARAPCSAKSSCTHLNHLVGHLVRLPPD